MRLEDYAGRPAQAGGRTDGVEHGVGFCNPHHGRAAAVGGGEGKGRPIPSAPWCTTCPFSRGQRSCSGNAVAGSPVRLAGM